MDSNSRGRRPSQRRWLVGFLSLPVFVSTAFVLLFASLSSHGFQSDDEIRQAAAQQRPADQQAGQTNGISRPIPVNPFRTGARDQRVTEPPVYQSALPNSASQPGLQQPALQQPPLQQPGVQQPEFQQPGMQQPGMQQPGAPNAAYRMPNGAQAVQPTEQGHSANVPNGSSAPPLNPGQFNGQMPTGYQGQVAPQGQIANQGPGAATGQPASPGQGMPSAPVGTPGAMNPGPAQPRQAASTAQPGYDAIAAKAIIETRLKAVGAAEGIDEAIRAEVAKRLNKAVANLGDADEAVRRTGVFEAELSNGGQRIEDLKESLASPSQEPVLETGEEATVKFLEQRLIEAESNLKSAKEELVRREDELKRRSERSAELTKLISDVRKRIDETQKQLGAPPADGENEMLMEARQLELQARLYAAERQKTLLETESKRFEALADLFPLERDQANRVVTYLTKEVAARQKQVTQKRKQESELQALEARRQVENALPGLRNLAERNAELAEMRAEMARSIEQLDAEVKNSQDTLGELNEELAKTKEKLDRASHSSALGLMLRKQRDGLPDADEGVQRLRFVKREIPRVQLTLMELSDERAPFSNIDELADSIVEDLNKSTNQFEGAYIKATVMDLLTTRRDVIDSLTDDYDTYVRDLSELELTTGELLEVSGEFRALIDEHILWIRSDEPLSVDVAKEALGHSSILISPRNWSSLASIVVAEVRRVPGLAILVIAVAALCFLFNGRLRSRLKAACDSGRKKGELAFFPTLEGLGIVAFFTSQWSLLLLFLAWRLRVAADASSFSDGIASALYVSAILIWASRFTRYLLRPNGMGTSHFEWSVSMQKGLRRNLFWFTWTIVPLAAVVAFGESYGDGEIAGSLGRVAFIACSLVVAVFAFAAFKPSSRFYRDMVAGNDSSLIYRSRHIIYAALMGSPVILSFLAIMGYYYSVSQLVARLQWSVAAIGGLVVIHAITSRWFTVKRRNVSIRQARERLASQQENSTSSSAADHTAAQAELTEIHTQLRYLLRNAMIVGVVLTGCMIWYDVLPALRVFDRVELWNKSIEISEVVEQSDGTQKVETKDQVMPITLRHALIAVLLLIATYMLGLNLPALLQITILERLPIDHGGRHAIGVIVRYLVTLAGTILACRTLHISWGSVQWLAAAMTVGLGFGMQEIFANFVSGLIILFERPVRVGDLVTVGGVTGRVTRTQIRATTITDYDRRELIVPNKKFITDDVMNWTLSDHVNRVVISVGVAYGSDTKRVRELLLEVASANTDILRDPEPTVTFDQFADSWLNFTLRCFLPNMDNRLGVIHDLHFAIDQAFRAEQISIAFPQQDVHVHGLDHLVNHVNQTHEPSRSEAA